MTQPTIILASSSPFRKQLLQRVIAHFKCISPDIDETPRPNEQITQLCLRLAHEKAQAILSKVEDSIIIASDQMAEFNQELLGKPGSHSAAVRQLQKMSGRTAKFTTSLCVINQQNSKIAECVVEQKVSFRNLTTEQIEHYLQREPAYQCAGSFMSEGLGIALIESISGGDPTALIGLPLISLVSLLKQVKYDVI